MRSALLILVTVVVLGGAFAAYLAFQPAHQRRIGPGVAELNQPVIAPATAPAHQGIPVASGENVFVETYDKDKGTLATRFRAGRYDPQPDGSVNVTQPEAEFFMNNGQVLRLRGATGQIVVPTSGGGAVGRPQMPSRGTLQDVLLRLYASPTARKPSLSCRMNNVSFDNDTFRISTEAFTVPSGKRIEADEVPVEVRGDDYDFDGRGLTVHWDEKDRRLQLLEIAHGQMLVLKHPGALGGAEGQRAQSPAAPSALPALASTDNAAVRDAVAPIAPTAPMPRPRSHRKGWPATRGVATVPSTSPSTRPHEVVPYRATFSDDVRVTQNDLPVALADVMNVDFVMEGKSSADDETPTTAESSATVTTKPARENRPPTSTRAATRPIEPPLVVRWTGKLRVVPMPPEDDPPAVGDTVVEMVAYDRPVAINWQGGEIRCSSFRYHSIDDSVVIRSSSAVPVVSLKDARGATVFTPGIEYSGVDRIATILGKSHAEIPVVEVTSSTTAPSTRPAQIAKIDWTDSCTLQLAGTSRQEMTIENADLEGDVHVDHPQIKLQSQSLEVSFAPSAVPATERLGERGRGNNVVVKQLIATDKVHSEIDDSSNAQARPQTIDCNQLTVAFDQTADGKTYPQTVTADGLVRTGNGDSELSAAHLDAELEPTTRPSGATTKDATAQHETVPPVRLKSLFAQTDVRAKSSDGGFLQADQLHVTLVDDGLLYKLVGQPSAPARIGDSKSTMVGPIIEFQPETGKASVSGAGSLRAIQQASPGATTRPVDVSWQEGLVADTRANHVEINGGVVATTTLEDGTSNVARGGRLAMTLADAPKPATQPSDVAIAKPHKQPASSPSMSLLGGGPDQASAFRDKILRTVTLEDRDNVEVQSILTDAAGALLRRINLFAPSLRYDMQDKRLVVPTAGRMLYQFDRAAAAPATQPAGPIGDLRGATAFQWHKDFIYDETAHAATMTGAVVVVHQATDGAEAYRMNAERVVAEMLPPDPSTQPATRPSADDVAGGAKVKRVIADGGVTFTAQHLQFSADNVEYDPVSQKLIARGTDRAPATLLDENGLSQGTFTELHYDTRTDRMRLVNFRATLRR